MTGIKNIENRRGATFSELEKQEFPSPENVLETLKEHADRGLTINSNIIIGIIHRADFSREQLVRAREYAQNGRRVQNRKLESKAEGDYRVLSARIAFILDSYE